MNLYKLLVKVPWFAFGIVWLLLALWRKPTVRKEPWSSRAFHLLAAAVAFFLLAGDPGWHPLAVRIFPHTRVFYWSGVLSVWLGVGLAIWARFLLGSNWSGTVTIKKEHELVSRGPYSWVRHPIYTGIVLAMFGTLLAVGKVRGLLAFAILFASLVQKAWREESFLRAEFGQTYDAYRERVRFAIIPLVL